MCTDGYINTILALSNIFCSSLHQLPWCCCIVPGPDPLSLAVADGTRWRTFYFFFHDGASVRQSSHAPSDSALWMLVCVHELHCYCWVLQSVARSAATWTVQSRPNFSIHRNKNKPTPSLCHFCATPRQTLSRKAHSCLKTGSRAAGDGCHWPSLEVQVFNRHHLSSLILSVILHLLLLLETLSWTVEMTECKRAGP